MSNITEEAWTEEQMAGLMKAFKSYFSGPFAEKYEDRFVEAEFWEAAENFRAHVKTLGIMEDPIERMKRDGSFKDYEEIRDYLKAGPPVSLREGWVSEFVGQAIDIQELVNKCDYIAGPKFLGEDRVVILDYWTTWCKSCIEAGSMLSDLVDKHAGKIAVIGINNDAIFGPDEPHDVEAVKALAEEKKEAMRYTMVIDSDHHVKQNIFVKGGYQAVPCMMVVVDNKVTFVGDMQIKAFEDALAAGIEATSGSKEE